MSEQEGPSTIIDAVNVFDQKIDQSIVSEAVNYANEEIRAKEMSLDRDIEIDIERKIRKIISNWPRLPLFLFYTPIAAFGVYIHRHPQSILDWVLLIVLGITVVALPLDVRYWKKEIDLAKDARGINIKRSKISTEL